MRLIIAGGRDLIVTPEQIDEAIPAEWPSISLVLSGGASGIDTCGEVWAKYSDVAVKRFPADWKTYGKQAGPRRNNLMALEADALLLFWNGRSKGSANMKEIAISSGLKIKEVLLV